MGIGSWSWRSLCLRAGGAALLVVAWRIAVGLEAIGQGHVGHEPARAYLLSLLAFACASAGAALLANGAKLFGKVPLGALWTPHVGEDADDGPPVLSAPQPVRALRLIAGAQRAPTRR